MKFSLCKVILAMLLLTLPNIFKCDIPVHCTQSQIVGEWKFYSTPPEKKSKAELYDMTCGHTNPSHESTSYKFNMKKNEFSEKFTVKFRANNSAVFKREGEKKEGQWTMVYDEGFDFHFGEKGTKDFSTYFVFNKYSLNDNLNGEIRTKWLSHCYSTLIGWYQVGNKYGCFFGYKKDVKDHEVATNGEASNKQVVVEGSMKEKVFLETNQKIIPQINKLPETYRFTESRFSERLELTAEFKDHAKVVERINSENLSWKAANYEEFEGLSIADLNKIAGRKKSRNRAYVDYNFHDNNAIEHDSTESNKDENSLFGMLQAENEEKKNQLSRNGDDNRRRRNGFLNRNKNRPQNNLSVAPKKQAVNVESAKTNKKDRKATKIDELPQDFSWEEYMSEPKSQGACGSCFAVSTITMLEARFRIKYEDTIKKYYKDIRDFKISVDHVLQCSVYNQSCDGGYSYLVSKFFNQFDIFVDKCYKKGHKDDKQCHHTECEDPDLQNLKLGVSDYYYVGGAYGKTNEENLMLDLYHNGPLVVSLEPEYSFMVYKSGVYDFGKNNWYKSNLSKPEWQKVDHSVVLVGWGIDVVGDKQMKYWLLQNSWGTRWGEKGYIKFRRGIDLLGIESIGEAAIPSLK